MAQEGYDKLLALTDSRYRLSVVVAKRAAQLKFGVPTVLDPDDVPKNENTVSLAMKELLLSDELRWGDDGDWVVATRREQVRSIRWGGDPTDKEVVLEPDGARLGPRRSFEEYVETVRGTSEPWSEAHRDALGEVARRLRDAVARQARRDRSVAAMVQKALQLHTVPKVPGADVAVTYRPAEGGALGGDWFDVYFRPDGRAVLVLGDVAGHGMDVASTMAQIRHALRAYVVSEGELAAAISRLNELCASLLPTDMATLVAAAYDGGSSKIFWADENKGISMELYPFDTLEDAKAAAEQMK